MKKLVFFPYHPDLLTLADNIGALQDCQIGGFISFKEDDARMRALNEAAGMAGASYERLLHECDAVVILDDYRGFIPGKYYSVIDDSLRIGREVLITPHARAELDLEGYEGRYSLLENLPDGYEEGGKETGRSQEIRMYDINTPIVGVLGQGKHCGKFKNQLLLKEVLEAEYKTAAVSTNALGALFGCYTMPPFLYEDRPFQEKIVKYNHFVRALARIGDPEVIILGIPEGISPFREREFHHFAEYPLIISSAVSIDIAILCTYFLSGTIRESGLRGMADYCRHRFAVPVGAIAISGTHYEIPHEDYEKIIYEFLSDEFIRGHCPDTGGISFPVISPLGRDTAVSAIKSCLGQLENNVNGI